MNTLFGILLICGAGWALLAELRLRALLRLIRTQKLTIDVLEQRLTEETKMLNGDVSRLYHRVRLGRD